MCGQVIQRQGRTLVQRDIGRKRENPVLVHRDGLGPAAQHRHGGHPVSGAKPADIAAHDPRHLPAGDEGQIGTLLIVAASLQQVRETDTGISDVDQHLIAGWARFRYFADFDPSRAGECRDYRRAHAATLRTSRECVGPCRCVGP